MNIVEKEGHKIVKFDKSCIGIIAYELNSEGVLSSVGVVKETNPLFDKGYTENLIMGTVETADATLIERAMKELKEEGGIELTDLSKWLFMGEIYTSKVSPDPIYLFAVNVTDITPQPPAGDGKEKIVSFSMRPIQSILEIGDSILISAFFKLFMRIYSKELNPIGTI